MAGQSAQLHTQLHNIVAVGEMSGALAAAFPSFAVDTDVLSTRTIHVPEAAGAWPAALYQEKVAFNWLFLNAGDMPAASRLIPQAQHIAPTLVYCRLSEAGSGDDAARIASLVESASSRDGFGLILSCHADADVHALRMWRSFQRGGATVQREAAWPAHAAGAHDPCYARARELILSRGVASLSLVQRTLGIGYTRASRLIEAMVGDILARDTLTGTLSLCPADARQAPPRPPVRGRP